MVRERDRQNSALSTQMHNLNKELSLKNARMRLLEQDLLRRPQQQSAPIAPQRPQAPAASAGSAAASATPSLPTPQPQPIVWPGTAAAQERPLSSYFGQQAPRLTTTQPPRAQAAAQPSRSTAAPAPVPAPAATPAPATSQASPPSSLYQLTSEEQKRALEEFVFLRG